MAKEKPVKGIYSNQNNRPDLDCTVCINRKECDRAREGSFCGKFQSREYDPKGQDPNKLWEQGEEVVF